MRRRMATRTSPRWYGRLPWCAPALSPPASHPLGQRNWSVEKHRFYPADFRAAVGALFLCVRRNAHRSVYKDLRLHLARDLAAVWPFGLPPRVSAGDQVVLEVAGIPGDVRIRWVPGLTVEGLRRVLAARLGAREGLLVCNGEEVRGVEDVRMSPDGTCTVSLRGKVVRAKRSNKRKGH